MAYSSQQSSGHEYKIREDQNLLSRTDRNGRITYAAQAFVEVSGYSHEELIGAPHSIVRHPDMPQEAFANLWQTLGRGEVWVGLVKNRRKNGDYYWVRAHVSPIVENGKVQGYTSVRVKPTDAEIELATQTYVRLRAGDNHGIRLERGRIMLGGLTGWLRKLNLSSIRARIYAAISITYLFLLSAFGMLLWRDHTLFEQLASLERLASSGDGGTATLIVEMVVAQNTFDYLQAGILLLIALFSAAAYAFTLRTVRGEIDRATSFTMQIAAGNLAATRPARSRNEFDILTDMLAVMQRSLGNIVIEVRRSLDTVRPAAEQVVTGSDDLASRTEQQAASLQQTAASMEEITLTVQQNADHARQASQLANSAAEEVRNSGTAMHQVVERMDGITSSSRQIAEIIGVIDAIAFQTNILALNASIEAARAGEHGRGFAVVASEVRSLATRSAGAAREVRQQIEQSRREVALGEEQVQRAERAIAGVIEAVLKVNDIMGEISSASDEQNRGIEQINIAVAQMDEVTQRNAGLVTESARSAHTMGGQVGELANTISVLRLAGQGAERVEELSTPQARGARGPMPGQTHAMSTARERTARARERQAIEEWSDF